MRSCRPCAVVEQLGLNAALTLDLMLNAALLGQPGETVSRRTARARAAGSVAARRFCAILTWSFGLLGMDRDHCTWALSDGPSIGREVWHWSPDIPTPPIPNDALTP